MKELSFAVSDAEEFLPVLDFVRDAERRMGGARSVLVMLCGPQSDLPLLFQLRSTIQHGMPEAKIAGVVSAKAIADGHTEGKKTVVSFLFFEDSVADVQLYDFGAEDAASVTSVTFEVPEASAAVGRKLASFLAGKEHLRAVGLIAAGERLDLEPVFDAFTGVPEDVEVFGGLAENRPGSGFLFDAEHASTCGLLVLTFAGKELSVSVHSSFGWKPLGRPMKITRMKDPFTIQEIDHRPAIEIYQTYLGLGPDEDILTGMLTFPLFLHRDGLTLARHPRSYAPDGSVYYAADFYEGEEVQLAYGDPQEILDTADQLQIGMAQFHPQSIFFVSCVARSLLLEGDTEQELAMSRYAPSAGFYAYGEFLRRKDRILTSNMTLVTVGMREGAPSTVPIELPPRISHVDARTAVMRHLVNFVQQSIGELEEANERYRRLARHDLLTGLFNRGTTDETLAEMVQEAEREKRPLTVLMMDIDDFKGINDSYGHDEGDRALQIVARILQEQTRKDVDVPGRMGGDEFFVILHATGAEQAREIADRIRAGIEERGLLPGGRRMTASIGGAEFFPGDTPQQLFKRADEALYTAKRQEGKNSVAWACD